MKLSCGNCQQQVVLDDSKVPSGVFKIKCPKCGKIITGQKEAPAAPAPDPAPAISAADELQAVYSAPAAPAQATTAADVDSDNGDGVSPEVAAFVRKEMAGARREIMKAMGTLFGAGKKWAEPEEEEEDAEAGHFGKKALICEDDQAYIDIITSAVKHLGYSVDIARSTAEAIKKIESGFYNLITVDYVFPDDKDGGSRILAKINGQKPQERRETFAVLVSAHVKSSDANAAFFYGANITVNKDEIRSLEHHIREGQRNFREIYRVMNRILEEKTEKP